LPRLVIHRTPDSLFDYRFEGFEAVGYQPQPAIKAPVAVCWRPH
jgi:thymidylate synthase